jgi:hypothetical protein
MRRFRVIRGGLDRSTPSSTVAPEESDDPALSRRLRSLYAPPADGYWDGLEATIMAAVRAGRAAPAAAAEWWQTLARWARPGLAAAAVLLGVVGGVYVQTRGARADALYRAVIEEPSVTIEPLDEEFARATDTWGTSQPAARDAADLLTDGVKRRGHVPIELERAAETATDTTAPSADHDSTGKQRASALHRMP